MSRQPTTAVVITRNRASLLLDALRRLVRTKVFEKIIVVDDASTDDTEAVVSGLGNGVEYRRLPEACGPSRARNIGASLCRTPLAFHFDDDSLVQDASFFEAALAAFEEPSVGIVALPHRNTNYGDAVLRSAPDNRRVWIDSTFTACAYAVRTELFVKMGGFREYLFYMGEEADLSIRMLDEGFYTACVSCTPIEHMQPKGRSTRAADFYGRRNDILVDFLNIPGPLSAYHLARATLHGIVFGAANRKLGISLRGLASGFALSWQLRNRRHPISKQVFQRFERLRREGPLPLDSLEPLPAHRIGPEVRVVSPQIAKSFPSPNEDAMPTSCPASSQTGPMRWFIIEDALENRHGHYFEYVATFKRELESCGDKVTTFCDRKAEQWLVEALSAVPALPPSIWPRMSDEIPRWRRFARYPLHGWRTLLAWRRIFRGHQAPDVVFVPSVYTHHLCGIVPFLRLSGRRVPSKFLLFFPCTPVTQNSRSGLPEFSPNATARLFPWLLRQLRPLVESGKVLLAAETRGMRSALQATTGLPFHYLPHPVTAPAEEITEAAYAPDVTGKDKILIGCYGASRHEKGTDLCQIAARRYLEGKPDPRVKFAIQWVHDFTDRAGGLVKKDPWLERHPQVDFIQGYFDPDGGYVRALRNTDLMLLPYRDAYRYRLSRVLLEAIITGIPAMVSKETTLAEQVAEHGAGAEFDQDSTDAMVRSIEECVRCYPELKRQALLKARSSREHFSVAHFRSNLVGLLRGNSATRRVKILYLCSSDEGGLAEYSLRQAAALAALPGVEVLWKAPESLVAPDGVVATRPLALPARGKVRGVGRFLGYYSANVRPLIEAMQEARDSKPDAILVSSWHEYFAPFWAPRMRRLRQTGIRIGAVIHDPVRDHIVGPAWWHRWSVREAYSFLDVAFSHDSIAPDSCGSKRRFDVLQIPHGPYELPDGGLSRDEVRRELGIPAGAKVMLSFGHIRDGKKLDQVIAALPSLPGTHLLVAGREQSEGQKPAEYYRKLAVASGVADRCHFYTSYIPNADVWKFFRASDLLVLTYSADFRSASGVLNVNAQFGLPVLVSAGRSPLLDAVREYGLGTVIERPDAKLIADAVPGTLRKAGDWPRFRSDNSWARNAEIVAEAFSQAMRR